MGMVFCGWVQVRSFNCDMYWPLFTYVLGKFCIWAGGGFNTMGALINGGRD